MSVVVFDIDGTLTDTNDVDDECYVRAVRSELGLEVGSDWAEYEEVTDPAILAETCRRCQSPMPDRKREEEIALRVAELLREEFARAPERFRLIPGADHVFGVLKGAGWRVAMATGAWRPSALVKLGAAGIPYEGVPLATGSDRSARAEIITHAVQALSPSETEVIVYVGDGLWDARAARSLGYGFVGMGRGERHNKLQAAGATDVLPDFTDAGSLLRSLNSIARG